MFSFGKNAANEKYPNRSGQTEVIVAHREHLTVLDIDRNDIDLNETRADAFVATDRGFHLLWLHPETPPTWCRLFADSMHIKLNEDNPVGYPLFFRSKTTGIVRKCLVLTDLGQRIADAYNEMVDSGF